MSSPDTVAEVQRTQNSVLFNRNGDDINHWSHVRAAIVTEALKDRPAVAVVLTSPPDPTLYSEILTPRVEDGLLLLESSKWKEKEVLECFGDDAFELSEMWFTEQQMSGLKTDVLLKSLQDIMKTGEEAALELNFEVLGCISDGDTVIWINPNKERLETTLNYLISQHCISGDSFSSIPP